MTTEILSAFVDGERIDPAELAAALAEPGGRETLIDFVRLRAAFAEDSVPSEAFVRHMRRRLTGRARWQAPSLLRFAALLTLVVLASVGVLDLIGGRPAGPPDEPPKATRVLRFEPGVDWKPVQNGERRQP